jgi:hypothetical protein
MDEAGEIDKETKKLYCLNKYLKGQTQTLEPEQLAIPPIPL